MLFTFSIQGVLKFKCKIPVPNVNYTAEPTKLTIPPFSYLRVRKYLIVLLGRSLVTDIEGGTQAEGV